MNRRQFIDRKARVMGQTLDALLSGGDGFNGRRPVYAGRDLPSESEVVRILALLDDVLFPGRGEALPRGEPVETLTIERLDEVYDLLYRQVKRALPLRWESEMARELGQVDSLPEAAVEEEAER